MHADLRMVPHESALFSRSCKSTSLWGRPLSGHCEGVCDSRDPGVSSACGSRKAFERIWHGQKPLILCTFTRYPSEASMKFRRNSTTEKSVSYPGHSNFLR